MSLFTNTWIVGIVGGIISGFIVFFITSIIANKLNKKDYYVTVKKVNRKTTDLLIMSIAESSIPTTEVINALIQSLAREYNVNLSDVSSAEEIIQDLIKDIYETNFIPIDKKKELSQELMQLIVDLNAIQDNEPEGINVDRKKEFENRRTMFLLTSILSISLISFIVGILSRFDDDFFNILSNGSGLEYISIMIATMTIVVALLSLLTAKGKLTKSKIDSDDESRKTTHTNE